MIDGAPAVFFQEAKSSALSVAEQREAASVSTTSLANPTSLGAMAERRRKTAMVTTTPSRTFSFDERDGKSRTPQSKSPVAPSSALVEAEQREVASVSASSLAERKRQTDMRASSRGKFSPPAMKASHAREFTLGKSSAPPLSVVVLELPVEHLRTPDSAENPPPLLTLADRRHKTALARARSLSSQRHLTPSTRLTTHEFWRAGVSSG